MTDNTKVVEGVVIESGVPLAPYRRGSKWTLVFKAMSVGDSIKLPMDDYRRVQAAAKNYADRFNAMNKAHPQQKFSIRKEDEEYFRLWRIS